MRRGGSTLQKQGRLYKSDGGPISPSAVKSVQRSSALPSCIACHGAGNLTLSTLQGWSANAPVVPCRTCEHSRPLRAALPRLHLQHPDKMPSLTVSVIKTQVAKGCVVAMPVLCSITATFNACKDATLLSRFFVNSGSPSLSRFEPIAIAQPCAKSVSAKD